MSGRLITLPSEMAARKEKKILKEGGNLKVYEYVSKGMITPQQGAKNLGITIGELKKKMELTGYKYPPS